jgi:hypothetical protein
LRNLLEIEIAANEAAVFGNLTSDWALSSDVLLSSSHCFIMARLMDTNNGQQSASCETIHAGVAFLLQLCQGWWGDCCMALDLDLVTSEDVTQNLF